MTDALISQTGSENASPAATSFMELETAAGVSEHTLLSSIRTLFKTTYDGLYQPYQPTGATYTPSSGAQNVALNVTSNNMHVVSGHASGTAITFTITGAANNQPFVVSILQGGTTVSTIAGWFATIRWAGGAAPTLTPTLNKRDTFGFIRTGADTYDGFVIGQNC